MTKERIVLIDVDGVVTDNTGFFKALETEYPSVDVTRLSDYNIRKALLEQEVITDPLQHRDSVFFEKYAEMCFSEGGLKKGFKEVYAILESLQTQYDFTIKFVTARLDEEKARNLTYQLFNRFGLPTDNIVFCGATSKAYYAQDKQVLLIFEDKRETLETFSKLGVSTVCLAYSYNKGVQADAVIEDFTSLTAARIEAYINHTLMLAEKNHSNKTTVLNPRETTKEGNKYGGLVISN